MQAQKKKMTNRLNHIAGVFFCIILIVVLAVLFTHDWNNIDEMEQKIKKAGHVRATASEEQYRQEDSENVKTATEAAVAVTTGKQEPEFTYRYIKGCPLSKKTQREIFEICAGANVSYELVMSLIKNESGWDPSCISDGGESVGLMQIQKRWHHDIMDKLGCYDLKDPVQNVRVGTELLKRHFQAYKEAAWVLMAYNGGQAYAEKMMGKGIVSEYASAILEQAAEYEEANGI